jgi:anti-sigma regulatory factor (Ser/Thr protein kinase)/serine/threonine protein phosphatase PrpC
MEALKASELQVVEQLDCAAAQQSGRRMALTLGFAGDASEEIALVVAELASNLVKHAGRGALTLRPLQSGERTGIEVQAQDSGPGMPDTAKSLTDGYSTSGTLGYGLGTVNRLMDEMDVSSVPGSGTQIVCRRWVRPPQETLMPRIWDVGVVTRSRRSAAENGDAFVVKEWKDNLLVGLIDGLGHGEPAQMAALAAQNYVQTHYDLPLDKIFCGTNRACRATRGVVMALARFLSRTRMSFASVGNVEARASCGRQRIPFAVQRGILGAQEIHVCVQEFTWNSEGVLILHTDGLQTRWQWNDFAGLEREPAQVMASKLMRKLADDNDDATVLIVKSQAP